MLPHAIGQPVADGGASEVVELPLSHTSPLEDPPELPCEIVDNLQSGIVETRTTQRSIGSRVQLWRFSMITIQLLASHV